MFAQVYQDKKGGNDGVGYTNTKCVSQGERGWSLYYHMGDLEIRNNIRIPETGHLIPSIYN